MATKNTNDFDYFNNNGDVVPIINRKSATNTNSFDYFNNNGDVSTFILEISTVVPVNNPRRRILIIS